MSQGYNTGESNLTEIDSNPIDTGSGFAGDGTQRVALSNESITEIIENLKDISESLKNLWDYQLEQSGKSIPTYIDTSAASNATPLNSDSEKLESFRQVKTTGGILHSITGYNSLTTAQYILVMNSPTVPANGKIPVVAFKVAPISNFSYSPSERMGKYFSKGIYVCNSTTLPTKTLGAANCWFNIQYS